MILGSRVLRGVSASAGPSVQSPGARLHSARRTLRRPGRSLAPPGGQRPLPHSPRLPTWEKCIASEVDNLYLILLRVLFSSQPLRGQRQLVNN